MTNLMTLHFFRNNSDHQKIDFQSVFEFFEGQNNFQLFDTEDGVEIEYSDKEFDLTYRYLITRKSRVNQIYKLNPMFSNVNFLIEFPVDIPTFLIKEILSMAQKVCKQFRLGVYNDMFNDVRMFNFVELLGFVEEVKKNYFEENGLGEKILYNEEKLEKICTFQRKVDDIANRFQSDKVLNLCYGIVQTDNEEGERPIQGICYDWRVSNPIVFPPAVDFIKIITEDETFFVTKEDLYRIIQKRLVSLDILPDLCALNQKSLKKINKRVIRKLLKCEIEAHFRTLSLLDCIEG